MTGLITFLFLAMGSFWILGYTYQQYQTSLKVKQRQLKDMERKLGYAIERLEEQKAVYEDSIADLKAKIEACSDENEASGQEGG